MVVGGRAAWGGADAWAGQPPAGAHCRVCSPWSHLAAPRVDEGQAAHHSLLRGQRCRASRRAWITRPTFSRVALPPSRPIRSTWGRVRGGGHLEQGLAASPDVGAEPAGVPQCGRRGRGALG